MKKFIYAFMYTPIAFALALFEQFKNPVHVEDKFKLRPDDRVGESPPMDNVNHQTAYSRLRKPAVHFKTRLTDIRTTLRETFLLTPGRQYAGTAG